MTEAFFPLVGTLFVMIVVLPACALIAKVALVILERPELGGLLHRLNLRYLVLTGASLLPLGWFFSAGMHQAETGQSTAACLFTHAMAAQCLEPIYFATTLGLVLLACSPKSLRALAVTRTSQSSRAMALLRRIKSIADLNPALGVILGAIRVTEEHDVALSTEGLLRPRVIVGAAYAEQLDDDALASALGHEAEHVRSFDPLRYLALNFALAVNPCGRWLLAPHAARWLGAQEAHCDREAVIRGAAPLSLAEAIVQAARPSVCEVVALGARGMSMLKFRIELLFAFSEKRPELCSHRSRSALPTSLLLLALVLVLPHQTGAASLDALHSGAEQALTYFWR